MSRVVGSAWRALPTPALLYVALLLPSGTSAIFGEDAAAVAVTSVNLPTDFVAARWLAMLSAPTPWDRLVESSMHRLTTFDRDGSPLPKMSSSSCGFNYAAGASVGTGLLIEFGTWAGASMRCFGAGLNTTGQPRRAMGFDAFVAGFVHGNERRLKGTRWWDDAKNMQQLDIEPIFHFNVEDVYPTVVSKRLNFRETKLFDAALGASAHIDVFITDAAKHAPTLAADLATAAPYLRTGSLLVFSDFFFEPSLKDNPSINMGLFVFGVLVPDTLQFLGLAADTYGYFVLMKPITRDEVMNQLRKWQAASAGSCNGARLAYRRALGTVRATTPAMVKYCASIHADLVKCHKN